MLNTSEQMLKELRAGMRGGTGTVTIKHLFQPEDIRGKARLIAEITLPAGASIGFHQHDQEEEIFYFISGQGRVDDHGTLKDVKAGDALITGGGNGHAVANTVPEPLIFVAVILTYV